MLFYCTIDDRRKISKFCFNSNIEGQQAGKHIYVCAFNSIYWLYTLRNKTNKSSWKDWPVGRSKRKSRLRKSQRAANSKREKEYLTIFLNIFVNQILQATLSYNYYYFTFYRVLCMTGSWLYRSLRKKSGHSLASKIWILFQRRGYIQLVCISKILLFTVDLTFNRRKPSVVNIL